MPAAPGLSHDDGGADPTHAASTSTSSNAAERTAERPASRTEARAANWREEHALMQHQLRQAKAEIAQLYVRPAARCPLLGSLARPLQTMVPRGEQPGLPWCGEHGH